MKTLAELQRDQETLPNRILAAAMDGDVQALGLLEQERATLPAAMLHAELTELRTAIAETKEELIEAKSTLQRRGRENEDVDGRGAGCAPAHGLAGAVLRGWQRTRLNRCAAELLKLERRLETVAYEQGQYAKQQTAPTVRNMTRNHIPGPSRWPG